MTAAQGLPLEVTLHHPRVDGQSAEFSWRESRPSGLYRETRFRMTFPESIPLAGVPARLWWDVLVMCLHGHWPLLRPCVVRIPIRMDPGSKETWLRLLQCHAYTLDAIGTGTPMSGSVTILDGDEVLPRADPLPDRLACAAAFSGGKDSLAQVGLLCEMRRPPLLVTMTSPHPMSCLEISSFRARALAEVQRRRRLELAEVTSDFRGSWDNLLSRTWGYPLSLNEMADTFLYTAALAVVGYARGASRLFLASENEVSLNAIRDGVYLQHSHFMYSALTQSAVSALMRPLGLRLGSLTSSLQSSMVQELVTRRFRDLSDLQCSCWKGTATSRACSECAECRRLALVSLSCGGSPSDQGVDMIRMLESMGTHRPKPDSEYPHPPNRLVAQHFRLQYARAIHAISPARMLWYLVRHHPKSLRNGSLVRAMRNFAALRAQTQSEFPAPPPAAGYRDGYLELLDEPLRSDLRRVLAQQFRADPEEEYGEQLGNLRRMIDHVTAPMRDSGAPTAPKPSTLSILVCVYTCHEHASQRAALEATEFMRDLRADRRVRIIDVHADERLDGAELRGDVLTVPGRESYTCLSVKTVLMVQAALALLPHFDVLLKVDSTLARYGEQPQRKSPDELDRLTPAAARAKLREPGFLEAPYSGLLQIRADRAGFEQWLRTKGLIGDFGRVFGEGQLTPPYYLGKFYSLRRDVCEFIASRGAPMAEQHAAHLAGAEDVMIGRLVSEWARGTQAQPAPT